MPLEQFLAHQARLMSPADEASEHTSPTWDSSWDAESWRLPEGITVRDAGVPGVHGDIGIRLFIPPRPGPTALVWAHGGGFTRGDIDMLESQMVSAELAARAQAVVISVDYRLALPPHTYPVPVDDVHSTWNAVMAPEFWSRIGSPSPERVLLGGASAGAALAVAAAMRLRDAGEHVPDGLLLAYPFLHFPNPAPSPERAERLAGLPAWFRITHDKVERMVREYVGGISAVPAYALPGGSPVEGLPSTAILISGRDDLASSGDLFHRQLDAAGIPTELFSAEDMPHGHLNWSPAIPGVHESLDFFARFLASSASVPASSSTPSTSSKEPL